MAQSIDLIPQTEKKEQSKQQAVKIGTIISIILAVITLIVSGYYFVQIRNLNEESELLDNEIFETRQNIQNLDQIEISARNLDKKFKTLKVIYGSRIYYSELLNELVKRIPDTVSIVSLSYSEEKSTLNISGSGSDYLAIAEFVNALSSNRFPGAQEGLEELFTNVTLNTVNLDATTGEAKYFIVVELNLDLLKG